MPTYPYKCCLCSHQFDVIKSVRQIDDPESCPECAVGNGVRYLVAVNFNGASDWDKAEFNRGLGVVTRNAKHRAKIAKERGLIEVGNEDVHKVMASQDRKLEAEQEARFEKASEPMVHHLKEALHKERNK